MTAHALWTAAEIAAATTGRVVGAWQARGVSIDSRTLDKDDLFVALAGPNHDGHDHVAAALARGAAAALVHRLPADVARTAPLVIVADSLKALEALGRAGRARLTGGCVAVTGSAGKTGTKAALSHVLGRQAACAASAGSLNNRFGVPLSLARIARGTVHGVFEAGMNHAGELTPLSRLIRPDVAIVTNVAKAHLAFFDSLDAVADAKAEIFAGLTPGGVAVLNRDDAYFTRLSRAAEAAGAGRIIGFGADPEAELRLIECTLEPEGSRIVAELAGRTLHFRVGLAGRHWVANALGVLAVVLAVGADIDEAATALAGIPALAGRGRREEIDLGGGRMTLIDESYNANPASMRAAIATLGSAVPGRAVSGRSGRRIAVLGDMGELGADAAGLHVELVAPLVENGIELVFTAGPLMQALHLALPADMQGAHAMTAAALAPQLAAAVAAGDVVMVKGSHSSGMAAVVAALRAVSGAVPRAANA